MKRIEYTGSSTLIKRITGFLNRKAPLPTDNQGEAEWGMPGQFLMTDGYGQTVWGDAEGNVTSVNGKTGTVVLTTNDLLNDSGFITNVVNNLLNYYLKSETYTKEEVNTLIGAITTVDLRVVQSLPVSDISRSTIYLVPKSATQTQNVYDEYINTTGTSAGWELIGNTAVDQSNYYTKSETDALIPTVNNGILTIKRNGSSVQTFSSNQSSNVDADIKVTTGNYYGTCTTGAATALKKVTVSSDQNFELRVGTQVTVRFSETNTAANPTLEVNNTGAKSIWYAGAVYSSSSNIAGYASRYSSFVYDGTYWVWVSRGFDANDNTKVTSAANHYTPEEDQTAQLDADASGGSAATWNSTQLVTGVTLKRDAKGHVTGLSVDSIKLPANPNSNTVPSAYCATAAGTAAKTATCTNFSLKTGGQYIHVLIRYDNTVQGAITLNINSTGDKAIYIDGEASSASNYTLPAGTYLAYYDGTNYYFNTGNRLRADIDGDAKSLSGYEPVDLVKKNEGSGYLVSPVITNYTSMDQYFRITVDAPTDGAWKTLFMELSYKGNSPDDCGARLTLNVRSQGSGFSAPKLMVESATDEEFSVYSTGNYIYIKKTSGGFQTLSLNRVTMGYNGPNLPYDKFLVTAVSSLPSSYNTGTVQYVLTDRSFRVSGAPYKINKAADNAFDSKDIYRISAKLTGLSISNNTTYNATSALQYLYATYKVGQIYKCDIIGTTAKNGYKQSMCGGLQFYFYGEPDGAGEAYIKNTSGELISEVRITLEYAKYS